MSKEVDFQLIAEWKYSKEEWDNFVTIEKSNKKEDNIYFGFAIFILSTLALKFLRDTTFTTALLFSFPFAIGLPFLRMRFSYPHLKKGIQNPYVKIFDTKLIINGKEIELTSKRKRVKSLAIIDSENNRKLLEFDVQWLTAKGPTNDEFRILIPENKLNEAEFLVQNF